MHFGFDPVTPLEPGSGEGPTRADRPAQAPLGSALVYSRPLYRRQIVGSASERPLPDRLPTRHYLGGLMPLDPQLVTAAVAKQQGAATDPSGEIRLVAGPGSGKSFSIEGRVEFLLQSQVDPARILAVSFTRNSAKDLQGRIRNKCTQAGLQHVGDVPVSTLHSAALRVLRLANLLAFYPVDPRVLDEWEMEHWIDEEFAQFAHVTPGRAKAIREYYEAWWSTGQQNPANYIPANPPVSQQEQQQFVMFHQTRV